MKNLKKILCGLLISSLLIISNINVNAESDDSNSDYIINNCDISIEVKKNGLINITEIMDVRFIESKHGIYRDIPAYYSMDWKEDKQSKRIEYYWPVTDIKVSEKHELIIDNQKVRIKIGEENKKIRGLKQYTISYTLNSSDLGIDKQMLFLNLVGGFSTKIKHANYKIKFEDDIAKYVDSATMKLSTESKDNGYKYDAITKTISGSVDNIMRYKYATFRIDLANDYFNYNSSGEILNLKDYSLYVFVGSIIILAIIILFFFKFGKDDPVTPIVMFEAPKDLDSTGVGFVLNGTLGNKDITSLFIYWANEGILKIEEPEDNSKEEDIKLIKTKELDEEAVKYQHALFDALFNDREEVTLKELKEEDFGLKIRDIKQEIKSYFFRKENRIFRGPSNEIQVLSFILSLSIPICAVFIAIFYSTSNPTSSLFAGVGISAIFLILFLFLSYANKNKYVIEYNFKVLYCLILTFNIIILALELLIFYQCNIFNAYLVCSACIGLVCGLVSSFMDKRTPKGAYWLNQILGLKEFIQLAEKDRLELLVEDNPSAFYSILPYAYVLGVSDVWAEKFEDIAIPQPDWYSGKSSTTFNSFIFMYSLNSTLISLNETAHYIPVPSNSGSGGFGGGGFGGGGGGGFGGGGGGSW